jgi:hypothetical protein
MAPASGPFVGDDFFEAFNTKSVKAVTPSSPMPWTHKGSSWGSMSIWSSQSHSRNYLLPMSLASKLSGKAAGRIDKTI